MALHPDKHTHHAGGATNEAHTAYCLDTIRQHVQCYGSTTLVPTQFREGAHQQFVDANQEHVCRDFSYLRTFVQRRSPAGDLYVSRGKALVVEGLDEVEIKVVEGEVPA